MKTIHPIICLLFCLFLSSVISAQENTDSIPPYGLRICSGSEVGINPPIHAPAFHSAATRNGVFMGDRVITEGIPCVKLDYIDWQGRFVKQVDTCFANYINPFTAFLKRKKDIVFSGWSFINGGKYQIYAGTTDLNGNITKIIDIPTYENKYPTIFSIEELPNKDLIFIGSINDYNSIAYAKLFVIHTDSAFNKISHKFFETPLAEECYQSCLDYEGNVLIACYEFSGSLDDLLPEEAENVFYTVKLEQPVLYKYNTTTDEVEWKKTGVYIPDTSYAEFHDNLGWYIQKFQEGYLTFGTVHTLLEHNFLQSASSITTESFSYWNFPVWELSYLNQDFEEIWSVYIDDSADVASYNAPLINEQGEIIIAGERFDIRHSYRQNSQENSLAVHKFSATGNNIFSKAYYLQLEKIPYINDPNGSDQVQVHYINEAGLHKHPDGGYAAVYDINYKQWYNNDPNSGYLGFENENAIALLWFDENGCIDGGKCADNRLEMAIPFTNDFSHLEWLPAPQDSLPVVGLEKALILLPNPTKNGGLISFNFEHNDLKIEIFDITGKALFKKQLNQNEYELFIDTQNWASGIYLVRLKENNEILAQKKWVIH